MPITGEKYYLALLISWTEPERGWGQSPDGYSLHLSENHVIRYIQNYWDKQPKGPAPDYYSRPDSKSGILVGIVDDLYYELKEASNEFGLRLSKLDGIITTKDLEE